jgi:hypothetical protein
MAILLRSTTMNSRLTDDLARDCPRIARGDVRAGRIAKECTTTQRDRHVVVEDYGT